MRFSIGATAALAAAVVRAEEASPAESSASVAKPTFTVRSPATAMVVSCRAPADPFAAHRSQGPLPGAVHR
jgi:hypothetical protein